MISKKIVEKIISNLNDRSGCGIDGFDSGIQREIIEDLENVVLNQLKILIEDKTESEIAQEILQEVYAED